MEVSPVWVLVFLTTINMVNYIDRGIVTGAPTEFGDFITQTLGEDVAPSSEQAMWMGYLQVTLRSRRTQDGASGTAALRSKPHTILS